MIISSGMVTEVYRLPLVYTDAEVILSRFCQQSTWARIPVLSLKEQYGFFMSYLLSCASFYMLK